MAETMITILMFPLILFLHFIIANGVYSFEEKNTFNLRELQRNHHQLISTPSSSCHQPRSRREGDVVVLEMKDTSHCLKKKVYKSNKRLEKLMVLDEHRVRSMQKRIQKKMSTHHHQYHHELEDVMEAQIPLILGSEFETLNYIVSIRLGGQNMTVIVDTGSDLTWVQCEPCVSCYDEKGPLFNPLDSPSYQYVSCYSSACQSSSLSLSLCVSNSICGYRMGYGDGSYSIGQLSVENLTFGDISVSNFVFGCGIDNKGLFGSVSGLMGLGRGSLSMISQTDAAFGGVFSYCLPTAQSYNKSSGSLVMGDVVVDTKSSVFKNTTPITYTKMIDNPELSQFYPVSLTGIDIGGVALEASNFGNVGVIIDSGTVITRLVPSIYRVVKEEFLKQFSGYPLAPAFSIMDTCFNLNGHQQEVKVPTMSMHFEGNAELKVDVSGMLFSAKQDYSQVCLALASLATDYETGIIGNFQQRNQRVIYDIKQSKLGFAPEPCTFN